MNKKIMWGKHATYRATTQILKSHEYDFEQAGYREYGHEHSPIKSHINILWDGTIFIKKWVNWL